MQNRESDTLLISYGALSRATILLKTKVSLYRPIRIFPMIDDLKNIAAKYKNIIVMEMNCGQYVKEVESLLKRDVKFVPVLGGNIDIDEIASYV